MPPITALSNRGKKPPRLKKKPSAQANVNRRMASPGRRLGAGPAKPAGRNIAGSMPGRGAVGGIPIGALAGRGGGKATLAAAKPPPAVTRPTKPTVDVRYSPVAPPPTFQGGKTRADAGTAYSAAINHYKKQLVQAALQLGAPEIIEALKSNPDYAEFAGVFDQGMQDPTSAWKRLGQEEQEGMLGVDEEANASNAFFSGYRLQDRAKMADAFSGQRRGLIDQFRLGPEAETTQGQGEALAAYNAAMAEALGADTEAALANEPEGEEEFEDVGAMTNEGTARPYPANQQSGGNQVARPPKKKKPKPSAGPNTAQGGGRASSRRRRR